MVKRSVRWAVWWGLCAVLPSTAWGRCEVTPGPEGELSTWLVARGSGVGPILARPTFRAVFEGLLRTVSSRAGADASLAPEFTGTSGPWQPAASSDVSLDLGAAVGGRGPRAAYAGVTLDARRDGTRWLFVGADDALSVWLDGREVFHRAMPRASRADDDAVPLTLSAGAHRLVLKVVTRGDLDLLARITGDDFVPDASVRVVLDGVDDAACDALAIRATSLSVRRRVTADGTRVSGVASWPGGSAHRDGESSRVVTLRVPGAPDVTSAASLTGASTTSVEVSATVQAEPRITVTLAAGGASRSVPVDVPSGVRHALLRARDVLGPLDAAFDDPASHAPMPMPRTPGSLTAGSVWSVERIAERLGALVAVGDGDATHQRVLATELEELLTAVAAGNDPYATRRGVIRRAYRSPLDGALQEYSVYLPPSYRGDRTFPMIVGLHGLRGNAHRMLPIMLGIFDEAEDRTHTERYAAPLPDAGAILVAPYGYGDAGYRQQGEYDVVRVVDEMRRAYRVDDARTYLTGLSMGGIGAAGIPFHHPDLFAAFATLCGYHSYFVRDDTRTVRRPWEVFLMELRSNASYAENGLHLPMYLVQGTLDRPLSNSQVLVERYQTLRYTFEQEWPTLGHNVWSTTYANGRIVPYLLRYRREVAPRHVRFRTPDLRWNTSSWVTFDALTGPARWGEIDVSIDAHGVGRGTTHELAALTLTPPRALVDAGTTSLTLTLDGDRVTVPLDASTTLLRTDGHWVAGARPSPRGGGPIREVFDTPMLFVVGTGDVRALPIARRVAAQWARRPGVPLRYPVVDDLAYTPAMGEGRTLVLIGTPRSNRVLAAMADRLPVRFEERAITVGAQRYEGADVGAVFTAPNPDDPTRTVLVIGAQSPTALLRSQSLPDLIPQWVVYDESVAPARGRVLLGPAATVRGAGFFDAAGQPTNDGRDPIGVSARAEE